MKEKFGKKLLENSDNKMKEMFERRYTDSGRKVEYKFQSVENKMQNVFSIEEYRC